MCLWVNKARSVCDGEIKLGEVKKREQDIIYLLLKDRARKENQSSAELPVVTKREQVYGDLRA